MQPVRQPLPSILIAHPNHITAIPIAAENAFGERNDANVRRMPRDDFAGVEDLSEGLIVSFAGPGGELPGVVQAVYEQTVVVDFNHPLAGRDIVFDVAIISVTD